MEDEPDDEPDDERAEADEDALAQLVEMLDERRLLAVLQATRQAPATALLVDGLVLARRRRRAVSCARGRQLRGLGRLGLARAGDGILELPHPAAERAADLRQPLGAEEKQADEQQERTISSRYRCSACRDQRYHRRSRLRMSSRGSQLATLELKDLHVALEDGTEIVKGVDLTVSSGEVHAIMGPNGSGKSTLAYAIAGHPAYEITEGQILLDGQDITEAGADERAQAGLFLAFQYPHAIPGVTVTNFLRQAINAMRKARNGGVDDPDAGAGVPQGAPRADGPPEGQPRARLALPERRLLGRREEARRDPADGDAEAADRGARRDRLGPRHRRAQGRRARASQSSSARRWARS